MKRPFGQRAAKEEKGPILLDAALCTNVSICNANDGEALLRCLVDREANRFKNSL